MGRVLPRLHGKPRTAARSLLAWSRMMPRRVIYGSVKMGAVAEAIGMIGRAGLNRTTALEVLTHGAPGSPLLKTVAGRMIASDYTPNFKLNLLAKDLGYALGEARARSIDLTTAAAAL